MHRSTFLSGPAGRLARAAPVAAGLALLAAVVSAGQASAAPAALPANCTQSGTTVTCTYTAGGESQFTVPQGVNSITATAVGAQGGTSFATDTPGGLGAQATGSLAVTPGQTLYLEVGVLGGAGGATNDGFVLGGPGGGESDVRTCSATGTCSSGSTLGSRLLVAGGAGGGGLASPGGNGGNAGTTGAAGNGTNGGPSPDGAGGVGGTGATQSAPGTGGAGCADGFAGGDGAAAGGAGGNGGNTNMHEGVGGGGGGAGWFGGGGGGSCTFNNENAGGGGGGTSHADASVTGATFTQAAAGQAPSVTLTYTQTVTPTATTLASSANPSVVGQQVTYTATVSPVPDGGTVAFTDGTTTITECGAQPVDTSTGKATCTVTYTSPGAHSITATYGGDNSFSGSSGSLTHTVNQAATSTALASSPNPSTVGQSVTFTATVSVNSPGAGTPTGTVTFFDGTTPLGSAPLNSSGTATFATSALAAGTHAITASYGGDGNFTGSTSAALTQTVNKITTTTTVASSANPSIIGAQVTYTATVSPVPDGGTVTFTDGGTTITGCGAQPVDSSGTATCQVTYNAVGSHTITAAYSGDATYKASTSAALTQQVAYKVQLLYNQAKANNSGSTVSVKLQLLNAAGTNLSAAGITVTVTGLSPSPAPGKAPTGTFTFLTLDQGPGYQLNIKTTGYPAGTYTLSFTAGGDPTVHTAQFVIS